MLSRRLGSTSLCAISTVLLAGCGGSASSSSDHATPAAVKTLVQQSIPAGKIPTPAATATSIPASDFTATLAGVVTEFKTHAPVPGVTVIVGDHLRTTKTDAQGRYQISFPARVNVAVIAQKPGYIGAPAIGKLPTKGTATLNIKVTKEQPGVLPAPPMPTQFGSK